jgi:hypothetical protein
MRTISRRLRKLEESFAHQKNDQGLTPAEVLRDRRRRRLEAAGEQYVEESPIDYGPGPISVAGILRLRFKDRASIDSANAPRT